MQHEDARAYIAPRSTNTKTAGPAPSRQGTCFHVTRRKILDMHICLTP